MGKDKKKITGWIREWFPQEFDHVFIVYLPNRIKKVDRSRSEPGKGKRSSFKRGCLEEPHPIRLWVLIVDRVEKESFWKGPSWLRRL